MKSVFNKLLISKIAEQIEAVHPVFDSVSFQAQANKGLSKLELKARSRHIAQALSEQLPATSKTGFRQSARVLLNAMGKPDDTGGIEGMGGFHYMPHLDYLEINGLDYPELCLPVMAKMTRFFSAEFAIRPFIINHPELSKQYLLNWANDKDWRVRRLASEGTRPRLPWGCQLAEYIRDPAPVLPILAQLFNDENLVVRRSVANNLNDISKDHPDLSANIARQWVDHGSEEAQWCARHAMRSLVKKGHPTALSILGYTGGELIAVPRLSLDPEKLCIGETLNISFDLQSSEPTPVKLVVDYALERVLANGKIARKVFKIANKTLAPGQQISLGKSHSFVQRSTRTYYSGQHAIEIVVNGQIKARNHFILKS